MWHRMRKVSESNHSTYLLGNLSLVLSIDGFSVSETFNHPPILNDPFFPNQHRLSLQWERPFTIPGKNKRFNC